MCGITGAVYDDPALAIAPEVLRRMTDALAHRGPDDAGYYESDIRHRPPYESTPGVALGHRRLSIIDIACGHQPISNEDGSVCVVFNGEIYNYRELQQRLEGAGHTLRTASDTETLVHLYEDEGPTFAEHLVGMFALAIWDAPRRRLVLTRDRLGQKPLYYKLERGRLLFGSELKSLLAVPGVQREIDPGAIDEYLTYQYVPHPNTIFRGIRKLPPGHYAVYCDGRLEVRPYWSALDVANEAVPLTDEREAAEALRASLSEAVRLRLQSEVPLGAFLSGGVDSSIITALMVEHSSSQVRTFNIGFADRQFDESPEAAALAKHLGTEHETLRVEPHATEILPRLVWYYDEPFGDSSALPTWYLSEMTRRHVTVALSGDGGDELFLGYPRYQAVTIAARVDRLPAAVRRLMAARLWQRIPSPANRLSRIHRGKRLLARLGRAPAARYLEWIAIFDEPARANLYTDAFLESLPGDDPGDFIANAWSQIGGDDPARAGLTDLVTYLPCDLMTKVDIATMAHGLECRQPFLDHRVVELALRMPTWMKRRHGRGKRILQTAFGPMLPAEVFRRPKRGFGVPLARWFREDLNAFTREILLDDRMIGRGYFRREAIEQLLDEHVARRAEHSAQLWSLLVLELWLREWVDR